MLHLKNMYGLNQPLRPYPSSAAVGVAVDNSSSSSNNGLNSNQLYNQQQQYALNHHGRLTREHSSLGVGGEGSYGGYYGNRNGGFRSSDGPQFENTRFDRKVTYLTDFPLTQSHSTEHMATVGLPLNNNIHSSKVYNNNLLGKYYLCCK
jgi:hypothetical protein